MTTMTPNKANIRKLVDALRGGEYKQTTGRLARRQPDGLEHCCLGVACEVAGLTPEPEPEFKQRIRYDGQATELPEGVREFFGFDSTDPKLLDFGLSNRGDASTLNDSGQYSFSAIADLFEAKFLCANDAAVAA